MHMDCLQVLTLLGFPTVASIFLYVLKRVGALDHGLQAILRDRLKYLYKIYQKQGFCPLDDREDWEYMYQQYHALGRNGVMDETRKKLFALPTEKKEVKNDD